MQEEDAKRREERERVQLERRYTLPDNPAILVHPNPQAKSGKFDCTVMSLSVLLDYRPEDNKEHSFEVRHNFNISRLISLVVIILVSWMRFFSNSGIFIC